MIRLFYSLLAKIHLLETTNILVQRTDKETNSATNATYGHAQHFVEGKHELLLRNLQTFVQCTLSLHTSRED